MHPPTKYEAKVKALEALDCPGWGSPLGGFAGLVDIP